MTDETSPPPPFSSLFIISSTYFSLVIGAQNPNQLRGKNRCMSDGPSFNTRDVLGHKFSFYKTHRQTNLVKLKDDMYTIYDHFLAFFLFFSKASEALDLGISAPLIFYCPKTKAIHLNLPTLGPSQVSKTIESYHQTSFQPNVIKHVKRN